MLCHDGSGRIKVLVVSLLYPLPLNPARGVFVHDHVNLLQEAGMRGNGLTTLTS